MKLIYLMLVPLFILSCGKSVEIPINKVGVVFNKSSKRVMDDVLEAGYHNVNSDEALVIFDLYPNQIHFSFDVIFKDASFAILEFKISIKPNVAGLPKFLKRYNTTNLENVTKVEVETIIRDKLQTLNPDNIDHESIFRKIDEYLSSDSTLTNFVVLKDLKEGKIIFL